MAAGLQLRAEVWGLRALSRVRGIGVLIMQRRREGKVAQWVGDMELSPAGRKQAEGAGTRGRGSPGATNTAPADHQVIAVWHAHGPHPTLFQRR